MMKINVVTGPFYPAPPGPCGAVERLWHGLACEFAKQGHDVTLLSRSFPDAVHDEIIGPNGNLRVVRRTQFRHTRKIKIDLAKDMLYSLRMLPLLPRADVTVTNVFWLPTLMPWLRRRAGKVMVHVQRFPKRQMHLYRRAASITTVSQVIADAIIDQSPNVKHLVKLIPNPIRTEVFVPRENPMLPKSNGVQTILFTGRVHPEKGLHLLVEAFSKLHAQRPNLRLRLVGPTKVDAGGGGTDYVNHLKSLAGDHPLEFVAPIYDERELAATLQSADFYCYPSVAEKGEASPVAPLEAMAAGLPTIVSDIGQFRGYITPGQTGCIFDHRAPDAADQLAAQFNVLLSDPQMAATIGRQAAAKAKEFSYARIADLYLNEFRRMVDRS